MRRTGGAVTLALVAIGVAGCGGSGAPTAVSQSPASVLAATADRVHGEVAKVWPQTDQIWPGVNFGERTLILTNGTDAWAIRTSGSTPVKMAVPVGGVAVSSWQGHPAVVVSSAVKDPFLTGTDAMFRAAKLPKNGDEAAPDYPLETAPRLDRTMLYDALVEAYRTPGDRPADLAAAAYWNSRWMKDAPDEASRSLATDRIEGTDGYFDGVVESIAAVADNGDAEARRVQTVGVDYPSEVNAGDKLVGGVTDAAVGVVGDNQIGEARAVNAVAAMNLDETHPGWKSTVWTGARSPLSMLLAGVAPAPQQPAPGLARAVNDEVASQNSNLIPRLDPIIAAYRDDPLVLIPATIDAPQYHSSQTPYPLVDRLNGRFATKTGSATAQQATALTTVISGTRYLIVPISPDNVAKDRVTLSTSGFTGTFQVRPATAPDGHQELMAL